MGIPRLIQTLQPFAERAIIGNNNPETQLTSNDTTSIHPRVRLVVIDGPSLVYHVYHRLLSLKAGQQEKENAKPDNTPRHIELSTRHPLLFQPSYSEIIQSVLAFINHLTDQHGIEVQKIYFDGALPASKSDVRLARLEDGRKKLQEFRQLQSHLGSQSRFVHRPIETTSSIFSSISKNDTQTVKRSSDGVQQQLNPEALFHYASPLPPSFKAMPTPPFMVAAVIDHLRSQLDLQPATSFSSNPQPLPSRSALIQLVPAEADAYCAAYARKKGAAILTSDSDLLAYDLGREGSVILLDSIRLSTLSEEENAKQVLLGTRYHGPSLTSALGISCTLQRFCFRRLLDPTISTSELKSRCRKPLNSRLGAGMEEKWRRFIQQYSTDDVDCQQEEEAYDLARYSHKIPPTQLQGLDPRIAELVTQLQHPRPCSSVSGTEDKGPNNEETTGDEDGEYDVHMYLPLLIEDTSRDSAWSYGSSVRHLAYTILLYHTPILPPYIAAAKRRRARRIKEYQRRGSRIVGLPLDPDLNAASNEIEPQVEKLLQSIRSHEQHFASQSETTIETTLIASPSRFWKSFALHLVSEQRLLSAKPPPNNNWAESYLTPQHMPYLPSSWDDVHNQASVEAVLYNLRILKQIASFAIRYDSSRTNEDESRDKNGVTERVRALIDVLASLPPIEQLMDPEQVAMAPPKPEGQARATHQRPRHDGRKDAAAREWHSQPRAVPMQSFK
ncbi:hypothetical protein EPUS_03645 [Endocarpon pusillum Z07020]|uniref:Asteroid domain-containing protein n=1 Tax=Endocarpon pusillum (strain Z07020 / HMAS-L-300199) TaxID=1263415 RepID=U1GC87_ENDPU|nr:uncharacterized protein EPUS_03645 [Endocarpon pusillum Z07020]ERF69653.1 hypothetical protein EPUS_03645 [Endocarpon pusillum Z07020]